MKRNLIRLVGQLFAVGIIIGFAGIVRAQEPEKVCFLTVTRATSSGQPERKNYVINDKADWEELWTKVVSPVNPKPALPEIDFTRRTIIGVFQGRQPGGGFEVTITDIVKTEGKINVLVKELLNPCPAPAIFTFPFHLVEVDKLDAVQIEFTIKQKVRKCS